MKKDNPKNPYTDARKRANKKYMKKFETVRVRMTPDQKEFLKYMADIQKMSLNQFINTAISKYMLELCDEK